jgi:UDP-N-acetylglucosamine--N-acetylmuramyl-(pentapeptide) pyrophosphoryl-undecaprenol N-acetylglucosamine transferase
VKRNENLRVIICAGGSGGHIFPACALFKAMQKKGHDVTIITDARGNVFSGDIPKKIVLDTIKFSCKNFLGIVYYFIVTFFRFCKIWFARHQDIVIGFGGAFTVIPLIVSKVFGSKIVIYEQNSIVGKANKFLEKFANLKLASFKLDESWKEVLAPVRDDFLKNIPYECDEIIKILVIGGSQGAASFSNIVPKALAKLSRQEIKNIEITQQVAHGNIDELKQVYENLGVKSTLKRFVHGVADAMFESQLVICRSGASTLSELSATGRPAILIPYPEATDNHQFHNAMYYRDKKAAWVIEESDEVVEELGKILRQILQKRELLKTASFHMINSSVGRATDSFMELIESI